MFLIRVWVGQATVRQDMNVMAVNVCKVKAQTNAMMVHLMASALQQNQSIAITEIGIMSAISAVAPQDRHARLTAAACKQANALPALATKTTGDTAWQTKHGLPRNPRNIVQTAIFAVMVIVYAAKPRQTAPKTVAGMAEEETANTKSATNKTKDIV